MKGFTTILSEKDKRKQARYYTRQRSGFIVSFCIKVAALNQDKQRFNGTPVKKNIILRGQVPSSEVFAMLPATSRR